MDDNLNYAQFRRFRWAHARTNNFLYAIYYIIFALICFISWLFNFDFSDFFSSGDKYFLIIFVVLSFGIPRIGYKLSRYIVGDWYFKEFGNKYIDYRQNEKIVIAKELLNNEI